MLLVTYTVRIHAPNKPYLAEGAEGEINEANDKRVAEGTPIRKACSTAASGKLGEKRSIPQRSLRAAELQEFTGSLRIGVRSDMCKVSKMHP